MAGDRSFISTPGRLQIARAASYMTISDRWRSELSRNCVREMGRDTKGTGERVGACGKVRDRVELFNGTNRRGEKRRFLNPKRWCKVGDHRQPSELIVAGCLVSPHTPNTRKNPTVLTSWCLLLVSQNVVVSLAWCHKGRIPV